MSADGQNFLVEKHSIDFIPHHLRHGKPSDLFFFWFGANAQMVVAATGLIAIVPGFNLWWAVVGIVIGSIFGSIFMAYHSAQGPHLGIPQMIQSRAQFGFYGAVIPLIMVVVMYLGFYAAGAVIGAEAISRLFHTSVSTGIILSSVAEALLTLAGYNVIHKFNRWMSYLFVVVFVIVTGLLLFGPHLTTAHHQAAHSGFVLGPFLLTISLAVINTLGYAPYVADYSRYLPEKTTISSTFWYSYLAIVLSNAWMMILGAVIQAEAPNSDPLAGFVALGQHLGSWFVGLLLLASAFGVMSINNLNIYGCAMSSMTIVTTFAKKMKPTFVLRAWFIIPVIIVGTYLAFLAQSNLLASFENFLTLLIDFLVPWTAINLSDYYILRHGNYDIAEIFIPNGRYGRFNGLAILTYFVGFAAELPFMNSAIYEGPIAKMLNGGDISWIIGLIVSGVLYMVLFSTMIAKKNSYSSSATLKQSGN